jgi:hypothetical protein
VGEASVNEPKSKRHARICFCTGCVEARDAAGDDHDAWRRAFPELPWREDTVLAPSATTTANAIPGKVS